MHVLYVLYEKKNRVEFEEARIHLFKFQLFTSSRRESKANGCKAPCSKNQIRFDQCAALVREIVI